MNEGEHNREGQVPTADQFSLTAEIVTDFTSNLVLDEVLATVARRTTELLDLSECRIHDYDASEDRTMGRALWARESHPGDEDWLGCSAGLDEQPSLAEAVRERRLMEDYVDDPRLSSADRRRMESQGAKSCLLTPLVFRDNVIGCLELVEKRRLRRFTDDEQRFAAELAKLAGTAIGNARYYRDIEYQAATDPLTGLYNRRYLYNQLDVDVARAHRCGLPLSVLLVDIDDFCSFKRALGRRARDAVLLGIGEVLKANARQEIDTVARYDSPDFAVIVPSIGGDDQVMDGRPEQAFGRAEALRLAIESSTLGTGEPAPLVTVSIGLAGLPEHADTVEGLIEAAEHALRRAKRLGKNRTEVCSLRRSTQSP